MLRAKREERGLSQREMARRLNKPPSYVNKVESAERQLNLVELRDWCNALEISLIDFIQQWNNSLQS